MPARDLNLIAANCTSVLNGHHFRSVRRLMQDIAESPLSELRNDQYGRGGFVTTLEQGVAGLLGKEAAVFMPSGTMAQPIALRIWADRATNRMVAFHPTCHLELYEHKAYEELHGLRAILLGEADRLFTLKDFETVEESISTLLIELPQREIGGQLPSWESLTAICEAAKARNVRLHLDGARLWECGPFYGRSYAEIVAPFDSVYVSFYKILGGLPGAMLAGPQEFIDEARIWQRRQGGNLHQQSPSAIAAKLGMDRHLPQISAYVAKAQEIAAVLQEFEQVRVVPNVPATNMMHLYLSGDQERLTEAALRIAEEDRVALFWSLTEGGKTEVSVGEGALNLSGKEVRRLFTKLFDLA